MTSDLLKCTICPKRPTFSDVSHLLTHVGSKGHLAHLHSLQVRSHQEADAGTRLAIYNRWYQDHQVASLLSDRMQQKEQKRAVKKAANRRRMAASASATICNKRKISKVSASAQTNSVCTTNTSSDIFKASSAEVEDTASSTSRATSQYPALDSSPPPSAYIDPNAADREYIEDDVDTTTTKGCLGSPQLKGTKWPGMDLFDAASDESKRKRNQRKDGSVLEMLERNAASVEPTETVSSCQGTVLKYRHMDELEDDSPVEGEYVFREATPKRRKGATTQNRRQTAVGANKRSVVQYRRRPNTPVKSFGNAGKTRLGPVLQSSPVGHSDREYKITLCGSGRKRTKTRAISIYEDTSPSLDIYSTSQTMPSAYIDTDLMQPRMLFRQPLVVKSQADTHDPFKIARNRLSSPMPAFAAPETDKENYSGAFHNHITNSHASIITNPLFLHRTDSLYDPNAIFQSDNRLNHSTTTDMYAFGEDDSFMPAKNPLVLAMEQLTKTEDDDNDYDSSGGVPYRRQPLFAP